MSGGGGGGGRDNFRWDRITASTELVKVAGVAPTELQELEGGSQSQPTIYLTSIVLD